jgi:hypothetical protein
VHRLIWNAGLFSCPQLQHTHQPAKDGLVGFMSKEELELEMVVECMVSGGRVKGAACGMVVYIGIVDLGVIFFGGCCAMGAKEGGSLVAFRCCWVGVL